MSKTNVSKVVLVGKELSGKSTLCNAIDYREISKEYIETIGVNLVIKRLKDKAGNQLQLHLWDTAGNARFDKITDTYIKSSPIILFCYSSDDIKSFHYMVERYEKYKQYKNKRFIFVMCKSDLKNKFHLAEKSGRDLANMEKSQFIKTSSFTNYGIDEIINSIISNDQKNNKESMHVKTNKKPRHQSNCIIN